MNVYFCTPPSYSVFPSYCMEFSSACFLQWYLFIVKVYCCSMHSGYSKNPSLCALFTVQIPCTAILLHCTPISLYWYLVHRFLFMQAENCRTRPPGQGFLPEISCMLQAFVVMCEAARMGAKCPPDPPDYYPYFRESGLAAQTAWTRSASEVLPRLD